MAAVPQDLSAKLRTTARASFRAWDAEAYLAHYYSRVEPTERLTLRFLHDTIEDLPGTARALDFGAGPTLHHAITLAGRAREVHVADLLPQNLHALRRWCRGSKDAHDWSAFTDAALQLEGNIAPTTADVRQREARLRQRLTRILPGDATRRHPLGEDAPEDYDCVTSFFCADSATSSLGEWMRNVRNICGLLAPGGLLVMGALRRCHCWRVDGVPLPSPCIDERHVQFVLDTLGFDRAAQTIQICDVPDQAPNGFESILLVSARARGAPATPARNERNIAALT